MEFEIIALRDTETCVRRAAAATSTHVFAGACHGGIPLLAIPLPYPIRRNIRFPPTLVPRWSGPAIFFQPGTLEGQLIDLIIDNSRARKVVLSRKHAHSVPDISPSEMLCMLFNTVSTRFNRGMLQQSTVSRCSHNSQGI
jgi:hypothetical protein